MERCFTMTQSTRHFYFLSLFALFLYLVIYFPGLDGDFEFDDSVNILNNTKIQIDSLSLDNLKQAAFSGHSGPTKRPISVISFALNHYFSGYNPFAFKLTNIIIHLINAILLLLFTLKLLKLFPKEQLKISSVNIRFLALIISITWLITPINLTTVLYIVQRMNSLSALFVLLSLNIYIYGRQKDIHNQNGNYTLIYSIFFSSLLGLLGVFSKENAALLPAYLFLIEMFTFRFRSSSPQIKVLLIVYFSASLLLLTYFLLPDFPVHEWVKKVYAFRLYNLTERLLTESRILIDYLYLTLLPDNHLLGIFHDDIVISSSLTQPFTTLASIIFLCFLFTSTLYFYTKNPLISFSIFWFFISHLMESTFLPLELMHEHRNYLASFGILLLVYTVFFQITEKSRQKKILYALLIIYISHISITTYNRSSEWSNLALHAKLEAQNHPQSYRAQYQLSRIYFMYYVKTRNEKFYKMAEQQFNTLSKLNSLGIEEYIGKIILLSVSDKPNTRYLETQLLETLSKKVKNKYIPPNQIPAISSLNECMLKEQCNIDGNVYISFMKTLIIDSHLNKKSLAFIHIFLGDFYRERIFEYNKALMHYKSAITLTPDNIQFQIRYMVGLANSGQIDAAKKQLKLIKEKDKYNIYKSKINALEARLNTLIKSTNEP